MQVGLHVVLRQAALHALQVAAVDGEDGAPGVGLVDQRGDAPADTGNARHLGQARAVQTHRQGIGQLRHIGATGAGVDQGQGAVGHGVGSVGAGPDAGRGKVQSQ